MTSWQIIEGDSAVTLRSLPERSVQTCVTSPPYFSLRDYGHDGQIGLEATPEIYVERLVQVFREVRRVLRDDGTLWLNLGDSYNAYNGNRGESATTFDKKRSAKDNALPAGHGLTVKNVKPKDLIGIPWMVAFALRADGWYLRSDIIWAKPNPMPESVTDRPTKSHEYLFLLSKGPRYFYDADAIREDGEGTWNHGGYRNGRSVYLGGKSFDNSTDEQGTAGAKPQEAGRNRRSVWTVATQPFPGAHFATFPPKLIEPCILAGSREGDTVLDPFSGAGTTGMVALRHGRSYIGCELNPEYVELSRERIIGDAPLLNSFAEAA
jgi:DNA modification methylase